MLSHLRYRGHSGFLGSNLSSTQLYNRDPGSGYRWQEVLQNLPMQPHVLNPGSHPFVSRAAPGQEGRATQSSQFLTPKVTFEGNHTIYQLCLDMNGLLAEELTVKMDGRKLSVSGKRDKKIKSEDGCVFHERRDVLRELLMPEDANFDAVSCTLTSDGQLCFQVPQLTSPRVTSIPVTTSQGAEGQGAARKEDQEGSGEEAEDAEEK